VTELPELMEHLGTAGNGGGLIFVDSISERAYKPFQRRLAGLRQLILARTFDEGRGEMGKQLWWRRAAASDNPCCRGRRWSWRFLLIAAGCVSAATLAGFALAAFDPTFGAAAGSPFAAGTNPHSIVMVDVNRDKNVDLVTSNVGSSNVSILLGDRTGAFVAGTPVPVGAGPHSVGTADFNRDKRPDLAVANSDADTISILLGNGAGTFTAAAPVTAGDGAWFIAVADLNRDKNPDLAVSNVLADSVSILIGDGAGGFAAATPVLVGDTPYGIAVTDLNRDKNLDLAVANQFAANVSILLGDGHGGFSAASGSPVSVGSGPSWVAATDLNRDKKVDLAVANQGSDNISILLGDGVGGFASAGAPIGAGDGPTPLVAQDVNGDKRPDLVVGNVFSDNVSILLGDGQAGFTAATGSPVAVGDAPFALAVGQLNKRKRPDIATANYNSNNVTVLLHTD
jgi:hypothetical protein